MAKACHPNADSRKDLFWKMDNTWVTSTTVFSFVRNLMMEYISCNGNTKPKPTIRPNEISDDY